MPLHTFGSRGESICSASRRARRTHPSRCRSRSSRRSTVPTASTGCSPAKGRLFTFGESQAYCLPTNGEYGRGVAFLVVPEPFDFELTTERFRAFGVDRASLWHEGGLHRVVGGREVRIEAANGGVDVEPLDAETKPVVRKLLGLAFELEPFYAWAAGVPELVELPVRFRG